MEILIYPFDLPGNRQIVDFLPVDRFHHVTFNPLNPLVAGYGHSLNDECPKLDASPYVSSEHNVYMRGSPFGELARTG